MPFGKTRDGTRIHYTSAGSGPPVVLLHGYAQTSHMWAPLTAKLAATGAGHWLMEEAPDRVIPKLADFLGR